MRLAKCNTDYFLRSHKHNSSDSLEVITNHLYQVYNKQTAGYNCGKQEDQEQNRNYCPVVVSGGANVRCLIEDLGSFQESRESDQPEVRIISRDLFSVNRKASNHQPPTIQRQRLNNIRL